MKYKVEAITTKAGNVLTFRVYARRKFLFISYWKFMCSECSFEDAARVVHNLQIINT